MSSQDQTKKDLAALVRIIDQNDGCAIADPKTIRHIAKAIIAAGFRRQLTQEGK